MRPFVGVNQNTRRQRTRMRTAALLLTLAAGALDYGCQKSAADNAPGTGAAAMPVQVQIAPAMKIPDTTEYLSILKSRHSAAINPQVEGQITRIFVKSGDHVQAGNGQRAERLRCGAGTSEVAGRTGEAAKSGAALLWREVADGRNRGRYPGAHGGSRDGCDDADHH